MECRVLRLLFSLLLRNNADWWHSLALATRYKNVYCWLHSGYMGQKKQKPASVYVAGFLYVAWWELRGSNSRPTD